MPTLTSDAAADAAQVLFTVQRPAPVFCRGQGSWLWDEAGRRYLDLVQGWAVNAFGHAPAFLVEVLATQAGRLLSPSPAYWNRPMLDACARLARATGLDRVFLANSGAEANEGAIKLARKWGRLHRGGAHRILTLEGSFHGRTLACMAATGKPGFAALFPPETPGFRHVPVGDLDALAAAIDADTVAVMAEPVQGEGGVNDLGDACLRDLRSLCTDRGILLILDEIQTGCGRCGTFLACQQAGVLPDILTLGKHLGAGYPVSALLCREPVACFAPKEQGGTWCGNALSAAVAAAVVDALTRPGFLEDVRRRAALLRARLGRLGPVRGRGMLLGLERPGDAEAVTARAFDLGLLVNAPRPGVVRVLPALTISDDEIDQAVDLLAEALP